MKYSRSTLAVLMPVIGLAACSAQPKEPMTLDQMLKARNYVFGEPVERIQNYRINGWNYLDDRHVIISAGVSDRYLVKLRNKCIDLRSATSLAFTSTMGRLTEFDKLMVSGAGSFVDHCWIEGIFRVEHVEMSDSGN